MEDPQIHNGLEHEAVQGKGAPDVWEGICQGIIAAGGLLPAVLMIIISPFALVAFLTNLSTIEPTTVAVFLGFAALATIYGGFICAMVTAVVAIFVAALVAGSLRLMRWKPRWEYVGAFCGALVGFLFALPLLLALTFAVADQGLDDSGGWLMVSALACLIVLQGEFGGAAGAINAISRHGVEKYRHRHNDQRWRFSVAQALVATMLLSVVLTTLRATDLLHWSFVVALAVWIAIAALGARPAIRFGRWRLMSKHRRRSPVAQRKSAAKHWNDLNRRAASQHAAERAYPAALHGSSRST